MCEGDPQVSGVKLLSKGLSVEGRGLFVFTIIKQQRHRQARISRSLRFEPKQWKLVDSWRAVPRDIEEHLRKGRHFKTKFGRPERWQTGWYDVNSTPADPLQPAVGISE
jgi:hypothetical protein